MVHIPMTIVVDAIVSLGKFPSFAWGFLRIAMVSVP